MPTQPTKDRGAPSRSSESIESYGQGQSGFTAGRRAEDPSLQSEIENRNAGQPPAAKEHEEELGTDERFTGGGRAPWTPEDQQGRERTGQKGSEP